MARRIVPSKSVPNHRYIFLEVSLLLGWKNQIWSHRISWKMMISEAIPIFEVEMFAVSFVNKAMLESWWLRTKRGGTAVWMTWDGPRTRVIRHLCLHILIGVSRVVLPNTGWQKKNQMQNSCKHHIQKNYAKVVPCQFPGAPFTFLEVPGDGVLFPAPFKTASFFFSKGISRLLKKACHPPR